MKRLLRFAVATLLCISAACTYAKAHNYDLPHICESGSNLSPFEISQKANFEMTVIPVAKQVMKEAGA